MRPPTALTEASPVADPATLVAAEGKFPCARPLSLMRKTPSLPSSAIDGFVHDLLVGFASTFSRDQLPPRLVTNQSPPRPVTAMSTAFVLSTTMAGASNWPPITLTGAGKDAGETPACGVDAP